jgi:hypothetical protein
MHCLRQEKVRSDPEEDLLRPPMQRESGVSEMVPEDSPELGPRVRTAEALRDRGHSGLAAYRMRFYHRHPHHRAKLSWQASRI